MKRIPFLSALGEIALGLGLASNVRELDDATFFEGVHLGATMKEIADYYRPYAYELHSGALPREKDYDIRRATDPQRRIYFSIRVSDKRVVQVMYWKMGENETFSPEERQLYAAFNRLPSGKLHHELHANEDGAELHFCSEAEYLKTIQAQ